MWPHLPTIFNRLRVLPVVALAMLIVVLITALIIGPVYRASAAINETINFQGRLFQATGAVVPDGYYSVEFKIYEGGTGCLSGGSSPCGGTLQWTEDWIDNGSTDNRVTIVNGFMSVNLGSITAFGSSVDWNNDTIWLSMNVAGAGLTCSSGFGSAPCNGGDGEMLPFKRMTAAPYALNSGALGGLTADNFVQLAQGVAQSDATTNSSIFINKTSTGNLLQLQNTASDVFTVGNAGDLTFGNNADHTLAVTTAAAGVAGKALTISAGTGGSGTGSAGGTLTLSAGNAGGTDANGGSVVISAGAKSGSGNNGYVISRTGGVDRLTVGDASGSTYILVGNGISNAAPVTSYISGTASSTDGVAGSSVYLRGGSATTGNANGGSVFVNGGAPIGSGVGGGVYIGYLNTPTISIGNVTQAVTQTINIGTNSTASSQTNLTIGSTIGASSTTIQAGSGNIILTGDTDSSGFVDAATGFKYNGTSGSTTTCGSGEYLEQSIVQGGIITSGTCNSLSANITLQDAYDNSGAAVPQITLDGTGNGLLIRDNATPIGGNLFAIQSDAGTTTYLGVTASGTSIAGTLNATGTINGATISGGALSGGDISGATLSDTALTFGSSSSVIGLQTAAGSTDGGNLTLQGGTGGSGTGNVGGNLVLQGGAAGGTNANGGDVQITGGTGTGTGVAGLVTIGTPTFQVTGSVQTCTGTSLALTQASVDTYGTILAASTYSTGICVVTLPNPTNTTAGRLIYITVDDTSTNDFSLSVNGGGAGNEVAMRANTTATMLWNGTSWAAAGASSSTTLQAAYDNTIQSSGGAELIISSTSNTHGLTIRDSLDNPVDGALVNIQSKSAANLLSVSSNVVEYASNPGAEDFGGTTTSFPSDTWSAQGTGASVARNITTNNDTIATGQGSVSITTTGTADTGAKNQIIDPDLSTPTPFTLTANNHYNVAFSVRLPSGASTFTDLKVDYSRDGTTGSLVSCTSNKIVAINVWTKVNCSFTAPSSGIDTNNAMFIRQAGADSRTFYVDNLSVTIAADFNLVTDGGVDDLGNFSTNWTKATFGGAPAGTLAQDVTDGQAASTSAKYTGVPATAKVGIRNELSIFPNPNTLYRITAYVKSSNTFNDFMIRYTPTTATANSSNDGDYVDCEDYNTRSISTTDWTKITCYLLTGATTPNEAFLYFVQETGTARDFAVDTASVTISANTTPNVQIGSGTNGGPTTLFTLDRAAAAPIAGDNDSLLGSMYYDTSLGKLQCYEADGWGACGSSPDNIVTISPEYTNAVMHGTGVGTMVSDLCSDDLGINDGSASQPTICDTGETYNLYNWTSPQATNQEYSIYVTYQLPNTFKAFASGSTSLQARVDSLTNADVEMQIYKSDSGLTPCGGNVSLVTSADVWQAPPASGTADPSTCGFGPSDSIVFEITLSSALDANAYVGNLNFTFSNF